MDKTEITVAKWHDLALDEVKKGHIIPVSFRVNGWSMEPFIRYQRDDVTIHPVTRPLSPGDVVLFEAKRIGGDYVLHGIWKIENGIITTLGYNCLYPDAPMPEGKILGIATEVRRGQRIIPMDGWRWKMLSKLWMWLFPVRKCLMIFRQFIRRGCRWLARRLKKSKSE